jgi:hypothetical protein
MAVLYLGAAGGEVPVSLSPALSRPVPDDAPVGPRGYQETHYSLVLSPIVL